MVRRYRSGWWLEQKYCEEGWTQREIAEECGVSSRTVRKYMNEFGIPTREVAGENHPLYGESRGEEVRERISETLEEREFSEETRERMSEAQKGSEIPPDVRRKISEALTGTTRSEETRRKMSESRTGEQNPMWKHGRGWRYGPGWSRARRRVRERDEVCQHCGHDGSEHQLEVHHIVPMWKFQAAADVDLRTGHDDSNLVLLCKPCHHQAEYGGIDFESGVNDPLED